MSICRRCGREIEWLRLENGREIPVDPEPVFVIEDDGCERFCQEEGPDVVGRIARPEEESPELSVAFVPHWKTCGRG